MSKVKRVESGVCWGDGFVNVNGSCHSSKELVTHEESQTL